MIKIEILSIGNEVVSGDIVNTNAAWLSQRLMQEGFEVVRHTTVADDERAITQSLLHAQKTSDAVLITGGLGPTVDDFTLEVAAKAFGVTLERHDEVMVQLHQFYKARNRVMTPNQERQAMIPQGGEIFLNPVGSAPGVRVQYQDVQYFFFPGVPQEMKEIFQRSTLPWLIQKRGATTFRRSKTLRCFGVEEAKLDHLVAPLLQDRVWLGKAQVAFRLTFPDIFIKVVATDSSPEIADQTLQEAVIQIKNKIKEYCYGEEEESLEEVVGQLLNQQKKTLAVAESCTGGLIAHRITNVSGSSHYFLGGVVAYSNQIKQDFLKVSAQTLATYGAVSAETATEMAVGVRNQFQSDFAVAVTGIAGPDGGTTEKPVGTVFIALAHSEGCEVRNFVFPFGRDRFKLLVSSVALNWVRKKLI